MWARSVGLGKTMQQYFVLAPIIVLFALGGFIALRSGVMSLYAEGGLRVVASNFSAIVVRVVCYLAGLFMVQQVIGSPSFVSLTW